ncbi:MAG: chemotaxis-specific protein-glutamate methyltransferase CheB [Burkholderiaceae bacterium]|jgi:two-component system chemotaxis response regulator CheB|nr:chemotaxis-specific protein-glutamate methyltransferase CheB [Burkholderiaceae bacterium]
MAKILVVDDSALMRRLITSALTDVGHTVQAARTGTEGVQMLTDWQPDAVTLDINMPEMDGLTALSLMMQARPTPVVMVSSLTTEGAVATFEALALGAVDFIAKPGGTISLSIDDIRDELIAKVGAALRSRPRGRALAHAARSPAPPPPAVKPTAAAATAATKGVVRSVPGVVVIGVSTGGPRTLEDILPLLPAEFPWPVVIAQHMPSNFTDAFSRRMDRLCRLTVREVAAVLPLEPGHAYIGKGGTDVVVSERLGRLVVMPRPETPGHAWHPSVQLLVESAMKWLPPRQVIGVQLTGMGDDGARAMAQLKADGGRTIAESEDSAVVFGMPAELIALGGASLVLPASRIAQQLRGWIA